MEPLWLRILGPFEVGLGGVVVSRGGGRRRALLAALAAHANQTVPATRLVDIVWGEAPPPTADNLVHGYVSYWRSVLDPSRPPRDTGGRLLSDGTGYRLRLGADECDALGFRDLIATARGAAGAGDDAAALRAADAAIRRRRGTALAEFDTSWFAATSARLEEEWVSACILAAELELRLGRPSEALARLEEAGGSHPLREDIARLRLLALYRQGRQADALAEYDRVAALLVDELGVDPGPDLRQARLDILRHDPGLARAGPPSALPSWPTELVGRERLVGEVVSALGRHRLVTLAGPGGSGKTRVAVEAAGRLERSGTAVTFLDVTPLTDEVRVRAAVGLALGLRATGASLGGVGPGWAGLVVLDNCEQVNGIGRVVAELVGSAPGARVLVTSRRPTGASGECRLDVPPLDLPSDEATAREVGATAAVRLFVERARDATPGLVISEGDLVAIGGICRRLDGLPLALELAATWTSVLSLPALLERLDHPLPLLVDRDDGRLDRHRSLRATLEPSIDALDESSFEQLETLAVQAATADLRGLEAQAFDASQVLPSLATLVDRHLAVRDVGVERYRVLETIRAVVLERMDARRLSLLRDRHAAVVRERTAECARGCRSPAAGELTARLSDDRDEVRAALGHLVSRGDRVGALGLAVDALPLWWDVGFVAEGREWIERLLTGAEAEGESQREDGPEDVVARDGVPGHLSEDVPADLSAAAHAALSFLCDAAGAAEEGLRHAVAAASSAGTAHPGLAALGLCLSGNSRAWSDPDGSASAGTADLARAYDLARRTARDDPRWGWARLDHTLVTAALARAEVLRHRDNPEAARVVGDLRADGVPVGILESFVVRAGAQIAGDAGRWTAAREQLEESLRLARGSGSRRSESRSLEELARLAYATGDASEAAELAATASEMARTQGHLLNLARCAALHTDAALALGDLATARRVLADIERLVRNGGPSSARRTLGPRRARLARLVGDRDSVGPALDECSFLEFAVPLTPERVVQLVERACEAAALGDDPTPWSRRVTDAAGAVGIRLPEPEMEVLAALGR